MAFPALRFLHEQCDPAHDRLHRLAERNASLKQDQVEMVIHDSERDGARRHGRHATKEQITDLPFDLIDQPGFVTLRSSNDMKGGTWMVMANRSSHARKNDGRIRAEE